MHMAEFWLFIIIIIGEYTMDSEKPTQQVMPQQNDEMEDEDDDLDDLGLFHKSSLKNKEELPLPEIVKETYNAKRIVDENNQSKIREYVEVCKLGQGAFAEVKKVAIGNQNYAMKIYSLLRLKSKKFYAADGSFADSQQMFRNQVQIIKCLNHGNLAKCQQILYGGNYAYVVMQLCDLGQIMDWSDQKNNFVRNGKVMEYLSIKYKITSLQDITRLIFYQTALGLQYLHKNNISNRDIKVDNILCKSTELQGQDIKMADFTTVRYSKDDISYFTCGTAGFRGPEIQNASSEGYSCKALDIWSLGISMFTYYHQYFPFLGQTDYVIEYRAEKEQLKYSPQCPTWLRNLLQKMTIKNWKDRITIDQVIKLLTQTDTN